MSHTPRNNKELFLPQHSIFAALLAFDLNRQRTTEDIEELICARMGVPDETASGSGYFNVLFCVEGCYELR
jgi:hypothetical protein